MTLGPDLTIGQCPFCTAELERLRKQHDENVRNFDTWQLADKQKIAEQTAQLAALHADNDRLRAEAKAQLAAPLRFSTESEKSLLMELAEAVQDAKLAREVAIATRETADATAEALTMLVRLHCRMVYVADSVKKLRVDVGAPDVEAQC